MAAVLEALASSVSSLLRNMVEDEVGMLLGVSGDIKKFEEKLHGLKDFLTDAERRRITDDHVQGWVGKLKGVMYDATDVMELCQLKAMKRSESVPIGVDVGCCNRLLFCLKNPCFTHDIGRRIRELNQRLDDIKKDAEVFSFINLSSYEDRRRVTPYLATRKTAPGFDASGVVGERIEEDTRSLVKMLVQEEMSNARSINGSNIMIFAIMGVGGIGKTTLAQMIFNNATIEDKFDKKIWLSINKDFDEAELLRTAISAAGGNHHGDKELSLLQPTFTSALAGKKIFLVMDDVWSDRVWNDLLRVPLTSAAAQGSGILVTTRDERVARGMKAVKHHNVDRLEQEDAWCLLKNQVGSVERGEIDIIEHLKTIGLEIIKRCDGLPLAIKAIGGLLRQRDINDGEWQKVLENPSWSVIGMPEDLNHAIYLSYDDLTPPLRQCFMHISLFAKKTVIYRAMVVKMWISEGFVQGRSNKLEELGEEYFNELILRNLTEPVAKYADRSSACTMHDVVRAFAHYVSRDEAIVIHKGSMEPSALDSLKLRRLFVEASVSGSDKLDWSALQKQKLLRTLMIDGSIILKSHDFLSSFSSLRTLYLIGAKIDALVDSLCQLKHLRYLRLVSTDVSRLPEGIGNMIFLQFINLVGCEHTVQIPRSITKLVQLRGFNLIDTKVSGIPRGFGGLTDLKTIVGFPAHMGTHGSSQRRNEDWCSLQELGPVSQLRRLELKYLENISANSFAAKAKLATKEHLTYLTLACTSRLGNNGLVKEEDTISQEEEKQIEDVFDELCPPPCLTKLTIKGYFGSRLPIWMMLPTSAVPLNSLRFLFLHDLACCTELPDGLCLIPFLQFLQVRHAPAIKCIGPTFVQAQNHHHPSRRLPTLFPMLHKLHFLDMQELEEWEWEVKANVQTMPLLDVLLIHHCKLRCIPPGLTFHATSLRKLEVYNVEHLKSLDSFTSVTDLEVEDNGDLVRIVDFPMLQKLSITGCPKLKVLEGVPELISLKLKDYSMDTLPGYLQEVNARHLELDCSLGLLTSLKTLVNTGPDWDKISHIQQVKAYAENGDRKRGWYLMYRGDLNSIDTNVSWSSKPEDDRVTEEIE